MKVRELERILREGMKAHPGRPPLALLAGDGSLGASVPSEFAAAASSLTSRLSRPPNKEDGIVASHTTWI